MKTLEFFLCLLPIRMCCSRVSHLTVEGRSLPLELSLMLQLSGLILPNIQESLPLYCSVERKFCKYTNKDYILICCVIWDCNMEKRL